MKYRDLLEIIKQDGWRHVRTTGSHLHFRHPTKKGVLNNPKRRESWTRRAYRHVEVGPSARRLVARELNMDYTVVIEQADDGYSVYVPDLPGCISCGDSPEEALDSIREAIQGHIQTLRDGGDPVPQPRSFASIVRAA